MGYLPNVNFQPYVKPYVGSANGELAETVKVLTQRYDENLDASSKLGVLASLTEAQVPEGDREYIKGTIQQVSKSLQDLSASEEGYYSARPKIASLATKFMGDPDIAKMKENKVLLDKEQAVINEMKAKGMQVLDFSNGKGFKTISVDAEGNKVYNTYTPQTEMKHDYAPAQAEFFNQLQADGSSGGLSQANIAGFLKTGTWQGITGAKIRAQATRAVDSYIAGTKEGTQQFRALTQIQGLSPQQAKDTILKEMISVGMERQFSQTKTDYMQDPMAVISAKAAVKGEGMKGFNLERDPVQPQSIDVKKAMDYFTDTKKTPFTSLDEQAKDRVRNSLVLAKLELGKGASNAAIARKAKEIVGSFAERQRSSSYFAFSGAEEVNAANKNFKNGNYSARTYQIPGEKGTFDFYKLKEKLGQEDTPDDKFLAMLNVSGQYAPGHTYRQGLKGEEADRFVQPMRLSVGLPDGTNKTIIASSDLGSTKASTFGYDKLKADIYEGKESGRGKVWRASNGQKFHIVPTGQETEDGDEEMLLVDAKTGEKTSMPLFQLFKNGVK